MAVFEDRRNRVRGGLVLVEAVGPLEGRPAEVDPLGLALRPVVDLLEGVLADVADRDRAGLGVEAEAPRISQPVGVDLRPGARGPVDERVVRRDGVGRAAVPVDGLMRSSLPSSVSRFCPLRSRIVLLAAVARADVEVAVRPELELAAVVVFGEVGHVQDLAGAALVEGAVRADRVADHVLVLVGTGEVGVDHVGALEIRREGDREESLLVVVGHLVGDVEGRVGEHLTVPDDAHAAALLDDVEVIAAGWLGDVGGLVEVADLLQRRLAGGRGRLTLRRSSRRWTTIRRPRRNRRRVRSARPRRRSSKPCRSFRRTLRPLGVRRGAGAAELRLLLLVTRLADDVARLDRHDLARVVHPGLRWGG